MALNVFYNIVDISNCLSDDSDGDENSNSKSVSDSDAFFQNDVCYMCNGFYGSNFGEPVCATCHAFLFPDYAMNGDNIEVITEKSDDGDSGNDEPADGLYVGDRNGLLLDRGNLYNHGGGAAVPPLDSLNNRIELLSNFSDRHRQESFTIHIENLPPEVLLAVFSYLDDFSLWNVANVCGRWRTLIIYEVPPKKWQDLVRNRFPLFNPMMGIEDWFKLYTNLMVNSSCSVCLQQMAVRTHPPGEEGSWRRNRLRSELKILRSDPPDGIRVIPLDPPTYCHWQATIVGPVGSPYEGGMFFLYLQVPYSYPMCPPVVRFLTKIFHPNISRHGDVGIDSIHYNWSLALTLSKVLISVQSLLTDPYCEVCMEPDIGRLYMQDRSKFELIAQRWTWKYAMTDISKLD